MEQKHKKETLKLSKVERVGLYFMLAANGVVLVGVIFDLFLR